MIVLSLIAGILALACVFEAVLKQPLEGTMLNYLLALGSSVLAGINLHCYITHFIN